MMYHVFRYSFILLYSLIDSNYSFHIMDSIDTDTGEKKKGQRIPLYFSQRVKWNYVIPDVVHIHIYDIELVLKLANKRANRTFPNQAVIILGLWGFHQTWGKYDFSVLGGNVVWTKRKDNSCFSWALHLNFQGLL